MKDETAVKKTKSSTHDIYKLRKSSNHIFKGSTSMISLQKTVLTEHTDHNTLNVDVKLKSMTILRLRLNTNLVNCPFTVLLNCVGCGSLTEPNLNAYLCFI